MGVMANLSYTVQMSNVKFSGGFMNSKNPVSFIVGGSGGIGKEIADYLLKLNFSLMLFARGKERLVETWNVLRDKYPMSIVQYCPGDATSEVDVLNAIRHTESIAGPIDLLVNCHGARANIKPALSMSIEEFTDIIHTDLVGTFNTCKQVAKGMIQHRGGCIINLSSIHGTASYPGRSGYSSAKSGILGLTRVLALELAQYNITANCISPGTCDVKRTQNVNGHQMKDLLRRIPLKKLVDPQDVAKMVVTIYENSSMTGQNIIIDCGHTASAWFMDY